jgi:hypothetical protein
MSDRGAFAAAGPRSRKAARRRPLSLARIDFERALRELGLTDAA